MGLFGPSQADFSALKVRLQDVTSEKTEVLRQVISVKRELNKAQRELEESKQALKSYIEVSEEVDAERDEEFAEMEEELRRALIASLPLLAQQSKIDELIARQESGDEPVEREIAPSSSVEQENLDAERILQSQKLRELENDNKAFAEQEAELRAEIARYSQREQGHLAILTRVFQRLSAVVAEEAGQFEVNEDSGVTPDLLGDLQKIDYEQEISEHDEEDQE